jgi:hypothetical protein
MSMKYDSLQPRCTHFRPLVVLVALLTFATVALHAQMGNMPMTPPPAGAPPLSPAATAKVTVAGGTIDLHYNSPRMRGRKIMGELVPYGKIWRTGANPATTIITSVPLKFGSLLVPAGTHTIYSLPSATEWLLIINNQTGQWGTVYDAAKDLGRVPMLAKPLATPQEEMTLTFENTTPTTTELHIRWETTDRYIVITAP